MRNGRKLIKKSDFVTEEQNAKKMEWLRQYKLTTEQKRHTILTEADLVTEEELIKYSVLSGNKDFKSYFANEKGTNIPSSLDHLNKEIILVEDGSEIGSCYGIKLNFIQFLQKYDFDKILKDLTREQQHRMTLNQDAFE